MSCSEDCGCKCNPETCKCGGNCDCKKKEEPKKE